MKQAPSTTHGAKCAYEGRENCPEDGKGLWRFIEGGGELVGSIEGWVEEAEGSEKGV